jgi:hypothetical protein
MYIIHILHIIIISSIQPLGRFGRDQSPVRATGMALVHCVLGKILGVGCHCFPLPLDIGREMAD